MDKTLFCNLIWLVNAFLISTALKPASAISKSAFRSWHVAKVEKFLIFMLKRLDFFVQLFQVAVKIWRGGGPKILLNSLERIATAKRVFLLQHILFRQWR